MMQEGGKQMLSAFLFCPGTFYQTICEAIQERILVPALFPRYTGTAANPGQV